MSGEPVGEAQSCPGGTFRHPKIRQTNFGGGWELNHLRDLQNSKTSAKLGLSSSIRGMVELCSSKDKVWRCDIRRDVSSDFPKICCLDEGGKSVPPKTRGTQGIVRAGGMKRRG